MSVLTCQSRQVNTRAVRSSLAVAVALCFAIAACGGGDGSTVASVSTASRSGSPTASPSPSPTAEPAPGRRVTFRADDGVRISARVFGRGPVGVVLGHQIDGDQTDWWDFAGLLADEGYSALTIDFRGYCPGGEAGCSDDAGTGDAWRDLVAGAVWLDRHGARRVVLIGASMGGTAAVVAASGSDVDGVITLSAPSECCGMAITRSIVEEARGPMLFIAGRFDADLPASARRLGRWAGSAGDVLILNSGEHGRDLLGGLATPQVQRRTIDTVLSFLDRVAEG